MLSRGLQGLIRIYGDLLARVQGWGLNGQSMKNAMKHGPMCGSNRERR